MNAKKIAALQALLTHPTRREAARAAGIDETTLRRYLTDEEFQREYKKAFGSLVEQATRQAQQALNPALSALLDIVADEDATSSSRVAAARSLLEYGLRLTEFNDILKEIEPTEGGESYVL